MSEAGRPAAAGALPWLLLVARHGATTVPGQPSRFGGKGQDPPLTEAGRAHAQALAQAWADLDGPRPRLWASPKVRSQQTLAPLAAAWGQRPRIAPALDELDYGAWADRTREEVGARWGQAVLSAWDTRGEAPPGAGFRPRPPAADRQIRRWAQQANLEAGAALLVSHGGRLRSLFALAAGPGAPRPKVQCGAMGLLRREGARGVWICEAWNVSPPAARERFVELLCYSRRP